MQYAYGELVFSFYHMSLGEEAQVVRLRDKLTHLPPSPPFRSL